MSDPIKLHAFKEEWAQSYRKVATKLRAILPADAALHHIGSTAIGGLQAKDIIDIQVSVSALEEIDCDVLEAHGFHFRPGFMDHCPAGMTLSASELDKLYFNHFEPDANIHVRVRGKLNQRFPLISRDYLRVETVTAKAYEKIKEELVSRFPEDKDFYYAIKDPLFDIIYAAAEEWAKANDWVEPPPD